DDVACLLHPLWCELADMDKTVAAAEEVHESAKVHNLDHLATVDVADLGLCDDAADPVDCGLRSGGVHRRDLDRAVILDVDLGTGLLRGLADLLAAGTDHFADLVLWNIDHSDARGVLADLLARGVDSLGHLAQDVQASRLRLAESDLHDLRGDRGD